MESVDEWEQAIEEAKEGAEVVKGWKESLTDKFDTMRKRGALPHGFTIPEEIPSTVRKLLDAFGFDADLSSTAAQRLLCSALVLLAAWEGQKDLYKLGGGGVVVPAR